MHERGTDGAGGGLLARTLKTAVKNWKRTAAIVFTSFIVGIVASLVRGTVYVSSVTLRPGIVGEDNAGRPYPNDSAANMKGKISRGALRDFIAADLNLEQGKGPGYEFMVVLDKGNPAFGVSESSVVVSCRSADRDLCLNALRSLVKGLEDQESPVFVHAQRKAEFEIVGKRNQAPQLNLQARNIQRQISEAEAAIRSMEAGISSLARENREADESIQKINQRILAISESIATIRKEAGLSDAGAQEPPSFSGNAKNTDLLKSLLRIQDLNMEISLASIELAQKRSGVSENLSAIRDKRNSVTAQQEKRAHLAAIENPARPEKVAEIQVEVAAMEEKMDLLAAVTVVDGPSAPRGASIGRKNLVMGITAMTFALTILATALAEAIRMSVRDLDEGKRRA